MTSKAKSSSGSKPTVSRPKIGRISDSGKFVIVRQATKSARFSDADLKRAVRKVITSKDKEKPRS
jgi:hypothetical protein